MRRANILQARKEGSAAVYSVGNPMIFELLAVAKAIFSSSLDETRDRLAELNREV